jgi:hypothetical protein
VSEKKDPTDCGSSGGVGVTDQLDAVGSPHSGARRRPQVVTIRAMLTGSDACTACGSTADANAPVLALCRSLIEAGHDPESRLEAWRGPVLCLVVRSIGEAARLRVREDRAEFARWEPPPHARPSPRIARAKQTTAPIAKTMAGHA